MKYSISLLQRQLSFLPFLLSFAPSPLPDRDNHPSHDYGEWLKRNVYWCGEKQYTLGVQCSVETLWGQRQVISDITWPPANTEDPPFLKKSLKFHLKLHSQPRSMSFSKTSPSMLLTWTTFKLFCIHFSSLRLKLPPLQWPGAVQRDTKGSGLENFCWHVRKCFYNSPLFLHHPSWLLFSPGVLSLLQYKQSINSFACLTIIRTSDREIKDIQESRNSIKVTSLSDQPAMPRSIVHTKEDFPNRPQVQTRRVTWAVWFDNLSCSICLS